MRRTMKIMYQALPQSPVCSRPRCYFSPPSLAAAPTAADVPKAAASGDKLDFRFKTYNGIDGVSFVAGNPFYVYILRSNAIIGNQGARYHNRAPFPVPPDRASHIAVTSTGLIGHSWSQ